RCSALRWGIFVLEPWRSALRAGIFVLGSRRSSLRSGIFVLGPRHSSLRSGISVLGPWHSSLRSAIFVLKSRHSSLRWGIFCLEPRPSILRRRVSIAAATNHVKDGGSRLAYRAMDPVAETGTVPALVALEERYRRLFVEQFERLTFKGISRSGKAV